MIRPYAALGLGLLAGVAMAADPPANLAKLAPPAVGAYFGAYLEFGELEEQVTLERIDAFTDLVGKQPAIIAFANPWGRGRFPAEQVRVIHRSGAVPLILWYPQGLTATQIPNPYDLKEIIAGRWDAYVDAWAAAAKATGKPILVSWALEMNGDWYPWSGAFHGAEEPLDQAEPARAKGPETYKAAYRHLVDRTRAAGADNLTWVFHANNHSWPQEPWNQMANYYPGSEYVDWLGMSAYGKQFPDQEWASVASVIGEGYGELMAVDPGKPILIGEWGVGEFPHSGNKADWLRQALEQMRNLPRLKGAVYWQERWQNQDLSYSNLRVNSSLGALTAFRDGIRDGFWLERPAASNGGSAPVAATR